METELMVSGLIVPGTGLKREGCQEKGNLRDAGAGHTCYQPNPSLVHHSSLGCANVALH